MIDYYNVSTPEESREMVYRFLEAMHNVRGWNVCISGSDEHWNDETNALSYLVLELVTKMGYQTPNLTMRVHRNTPEALWRAAAECIATGIGICTAGKDLSVFEQGNCMSFAAGDGSYI